MPADHSVAKESNEANDEADLVKTLVSLIDSAKYSVDLAIYDLENMKVGEALVRAAKRESGSVWLQITTTDPQ